MFKFKEKIDAKKQEFLLPEFCLEQRELSF